MIESALVGGTSGVLAGNVLDNVTQNDAEKTLLRILDRLDWIERVLRMPDRVKWQAPAKGEFWATYNASTTPVAGSEQVFQPEQMFYPLGTTIIVSDLTLPAGTSRWNLLIGSRPVPIALPPIGNATIPLQDNISGVTISIRPTVVATGFIYGSMLGYYQSDIVNMLAGMTNLVGL